MHTEENEMTFSGFAKYCGVSPATVTNWRTAELIVYTPRGRLAVRESVAKLIAAGRLEDPAKSDNPLDRIADGFKKPLPQKRHTARDRLDVAKAKLAELKVQRELAEVVEVDRVSKAWYVMLRKLRNRLRAIPSRVAAKAAALDGEHEIRVMFEGEIDEALRMAEYPPGEIASAKSPKGRKRKA